MAEDNLDKLTEQEFLTVRAAGTTYASAVALIAALGKNGVFQSPLTKFGVGFLLLGTAGAVLYQLILIDRKRGASSSTIIKTTATLFVLAGVVGFILIGMAVWLA